MNIQNAELHVIFGTGPVGMAIMAELHRQGKRIRMVNRSGKGDFAAGVEVMTGDVSDVTFTRQAAAGASVVYSATNPPYTQWPELFPALQAGVIAGAAAAGAKLIVMENLYLYGHTHGQPMTEAMPANPHTRKGKVRAQMTRDLLAAHDSGKVRVVVGRASDFVGPRVLDSAMGERVFPVVLAGQTVRVIGHPDMPHTYTYMPDIGKALVTLGEHDSALGQVWHIPAAETVTTRRFVEMIGEEIGKPVRVAGVPKLLLKGMALFMPLMREVEEMAYEFEEPFIVDHSKYVSAFGNHATPLRDVIRETVRWYQARPAH